jgi:sugar/nucleoside kinase (ribokinase family)
MTLVDDDEAARVYAAVTPVAAVPGGSAANTAVGVASLGGRAGFLGKVATDELGEVFARDIRSAGVHFGVPPEAGGVGTGRCVVMVTPDAEKTMCTSLGIGDLLGVADVDAALIAGADVVYLEGYLCGLPHTDATVAAVLDAAEAAGTPVALSLSDPLWVELHGAEMATLLGRVDLVFANEHEARLLTGETDLDRAVRALAERCATVVVTRGAQGSTVSAGGEWVDVDAVRVPEVVDTTGAGDLYAGGFLFGHVRHLGPERCARIASLAAAEVVGHLGARPERPLVELAEMAGLL